MICPSTVQCWLILITTHPFLNAYAVLASSAVVILLIVIIVLLLYMYKRFKYRYDVGPLDFIVVHE